MLFEHRADCNHPAVEPVALGSVLTVDDAADQGSVVIRCRGDTARTTGGKALQQKPLRSGENREGGKLLQ